MFAALLPRRIRPALLVPAALFSFALSARPAAAVLVHPCLARDYLAPGPQISPESRRLHGRITLVEADSFFLRVNDGRVSVPLTLGETVFITLDARPGNLSELAPGQEVMVEYREAEGGPIASAIQVLTPLGGQPDHQLARQR